MSAPGFRGRTARFFVFAFPRFFRDGPGYVLNMGGIYLLGLRRGGIFVIVLGEKNREEDKQRNSQGYEYGYQAWTPYTVQLYSKFVRFSVNFQH